MLMAQYALNSAKFCRPKERPLRLFETAMQKVTAASQDNKPSVFDRLTSQAAEGNAAAAATASTVVKRLQRSAAAAKRQGDSDCKLKCCLTL